MDKIIITIFGVLFIAFVAWFFFGKKKNDDMADMDMEGMDHMNM